MTSLRDTTHQPKDNLITCLIAGGAGFIGSHLCQLLLEQNCYIYCVDNFSTGLRSNLQVLSRHSNFKLLEHDLSLNALPNLERKLDYVFHVASVEAYMNGINVDFSTLLVNSFGTKSLLQMAVEHEAKFLLASTESVYDQTHGNRQFENYFGSSRAQQGQSLFIEAKRFAEALTVEYAREQHVDARIVRLAYLYGPHMNIESGNVIASLFKAVVQNKTLKIPNDGMAPLYPTYISDAAYGLIKAMFSQSSAGKIYGLVSTQPVTILNLAYKIQELNGTRLPVDYYDDPSFYNSLTVSADVFKSQEALGWYPRQDLTAGLQKTLSWLRQEYGERVRNESSSLVVSTANIPEAYRQPQETTVVRPQQVAVVADGEPSTEQNMVVAVQSDLAAHAKMAEHTQLTQQEPPHITIQPAVVNTSLLHNIKTSLQRWRGRQVKTVSATTKKPMPAWWPLGVVTLGIVLLLVIPTPLLILVTKQSITHLVAAGAALEMGQWEQSQNELNGAEQSAALMDSLYPVVRLEHNLIHQSVPGKIADFYQVYKKLTTALGAIAKAQQGMGKLSEIMYGHQTDEPQQVLDEVTASLSLANEQLAVLSAEIDNVKEMNQYGGEIKRWQEYVGACLQLTPLLADSLAYNDKRTLLVLLQDNHELRPTGGFIEGLMVVSADKGHLLDVQFLDVYETDKLLKGAVEPPDEIKKYLGEENWWLRDSNTSPDFPTTAARAAWFLQKEKGITVHGVAAINLSFLREVLSVMGEVTVDEYQDSVNSVNIFEKAQKHVKINVLDDTGNKKPSFIVALARAINNKLQSSSAMSVAVLSLPVHRALEERNAFLWLPNTSADTTLLQNGWSGALRQTPDQLVEFGQVDVHDYLGYFEANFGVNKANYYVQRKINHDVAITTQGQVLVDSTISITNSSPSSTWPVGKYKNYVRLYIPEGSEPTSVLAGTSQKLEPLQDSDDIVRGKEKGKNYIGVFIEIPPGEQRTVQIHYALKDSAALLKPSLVYALYAQKQSGTENTPITVKLTYPETLKPVKLSKNAQLNNGSLQFNEILTTDHVFAVSFSR